MVIDKLRTVATVYMRRNMWRNYTEAKMEKCMMTREWRRRHKGMRRILDQRYLRFADDQAMVAKSQKGLQAEMDRLVTTSREYRMRINIKKQRC